MGWARRNLDCRNLSPDEPTFLQEETHVVHLVELHHVEDEYAYISGTISNGDQVVVGGALRVIEGQFLK